MLEDGIIHKSTFGKTSNTNDNPYASNRRVNLQISKSTKESTTTLLENAEKTETPQRLVNISKHFQIQIRHENKKNTERNFCIAILTQLLHAKLKHLATN